jgi:alpha/beta superfamily hydrolase
MPEVIFPGDEGRIEGRYYPSKSKTSPIALVMHAHPETAGGTMNSSVPYNLYHAFRRLNFSVLRFNFRGVGRSGGKFSSGVGELYDAATAMDYLQALNPDSRECWVAGFSFGAWIGMQLLMRRPEIRGFVAVSPPTSHYDFSFLSPCPASGLIVHGEKDKITPVDGVDAFKKRVKIQKDVEVDFKMISNANHFFDSSMDGMITCVEDYVRTMSEKRKNIILPVRKRARNRSSVQSQPVATIA